jgi:hypothetical protein
VDDRELMVLVNDKLEAIAEEIDPVGWELSRVGIGRKGAENQGQDA